VTKILAEATAAPKEKAAAAAAPAKTK